MLAMFPFHHNIAFHPQFNAKQNSPLTWILSPLAHILKVSKMLDLVLILDGD